MYVWNEFKTVLVVRSYRVQKFLRTGDTRNIYRNDLDKTCFQDDMAYGSYKDLVKRKESDKSLRDKAFKIASDPRYMMDIKED